MGKLATINRIIWDSGWHGGNRAKALCLSESDQADWIGLGACGLPDSQPHWIRECRADGPLPL